MTLATYEAAAQRYRERAGPPGADLVSFLERLVEIVGIGDVLELGSGPGRDATYLESRGLRVMRTDAAQAFVDMMRADGCQARLLDVRTGELGGPFDAVLADATLLHLTRGEFSEVLVRIRGAVYDRGRESLPCARRWSAPGGRCCRSITLPVDTNRGSMCSHGPHSNRPRSPVRESFWS
jgi:SAM-dependent methyltransferase